VSEIFSIKDIKTETEKHWRRRHASHRVCLITTRDGDISLTTLHCKKCNEMFLVNYNTIQELPKEKR